MLDSIVNLVRDQVSELISKNEKVAADKKEDIIDATTSILIDGFIANFTEENSSSLSGLFFTGNYDGLDWIENLQASIIYVLSEKIGVNQDVARNIASTVVPPVVNMLSDKVKDTNQPGFTLESVVNAFSNNLK